MRSRIFLATFVGAIPWVATAREVSFNEDIRPLFTQHCAACHGGVKAAGGLSFLYREKALAAGKSGQIAIVPGKPAESEVIRRVTSSDPEERMPKPDHGPELSPTEVETLRAWIEQGANWQEHWSFLPPVEPAEPALKMADWPRGKADALILARLEGEGLAPAPAAPPEEWLRRVSLDLAGLPPTLEEWGAFRQRLTEAPDAAHGEVVDRLLESPHFGERWAVTWLDLARYSDTQGYEKDPHRDIWPWRDWVIRAFNADMPFDQFTIKQLAGDLLPTPAPEDLIATAFHRNTQTNTEGGTDDEEFRVAAVIDRVSTTWTAWQATTFGCVQCHDHPYDPFPHRDYYRFMAFFDNTEDHDHNDDFPHVRAANEPARQEEATRLEREASAQRQRLNDAGLALAKQIADWRPLAAERAATSGGAIQAEASGKFTTSGTLPVGVVYTLDMAVPEATALRLTIFPDSDDPKKWPERGSVLSHLEAFLLDGEQRKPVALKEVIADYLAGRFDPQDTLDKDLGGFGSYPVLAGSRQAVIVLAEPLRASPSAKLQLIMHQTAAYNEGQQAATLRTFRWESSRDARWTELVTAPERAAHWQELAETKKRLAALPGITVPVLRQRPEGTRETRLFTRGSRLTKAEAVSPGIPEIVRPPAVENPTRLDMARWLVSEANPLTAKVLANRLWAEMFGRGIVETLEDFGTSGQPPSHPALLDHLALRLAKHHAWRIKPFLRELALSSVYRQSPKATAEMLARDPANRLLARGPRHRLSAEMVRDQALLVSGLLSRKQHGPPVFPPQPDGVWNSVYNGATWKTSKGEDRHRRALYTYSKRTSGYPALLTFDAPTRDNCAARRIATNTPLQALVALNDPAFLEMAMALAERMAKAGDTAESRVAKGYEILALQPPAAETLQSLLRLHAAALAEFQDDPKAGEGIAPRLEIAALAVVANALFNLDVALNR